MFQFLYISLFWAQHFYYLSEIRYFFHILLKFPKLFFFAWIYKYVYLTLPIYAWQIFTTNCLHSSFESLTLMLAYMSLCAQRALFYGYERQYFFDMQIYMFVLKPFNLRVFFFSCFPILLYISRFWFILEWCAHTFFFYRNILLHDLWYYDKMVFIFGW